MQFIALFASTPTAVWGAEVSANLGVGLRYESNVNRDSNTGDSVGDYGIRIGPNVGITDVQEDYRYDVNYNLSYVKFKDRSTVDDVDHTMTGSFKYTLSPRITVQGKESFYLTNNLIRDFNPDDLETPLDESGTIIVLLPGDTIIVPD